MISKGQFLEEFDKLCASFGDRKFSKHALEVWFQEVENTEFNQFKAAMRGLTMGEHWFDRNQAFPKYPDFWKVYRDKAKLFTPPGGEVQGCSGCRHGWIHYVREFGDPVQSYDYVAACKVCQPRAKIAVDPDQHFNYVPSMEPHRYQNAVNIPRNTAIAMCQELGEKMQRAMFKRKKIDWVREEVEAWALHSKASARARV